MVRLAARVGFTWSGDVVLAPKDGSKLGGQVRNQFTAGPKNGVLDSRRDVGSILNNCDHRQAAFEQDPETKGASRIDGVEGDDEAGCPKAVTKATHPHWREPSSLDCSSNDVTELRRALPRRYDHGQSFPVYLNHG